MAWTAHALKVVVGGKIAGDIWRTSWVHGIGLLAGDLTASQVNNILSANVSTAVSTWWTACKAMNASSVDYSYLTAYYYTIGGTNAYSQGQFAVTAVPGTGSSTGGVLPFRTALSVAKRSNFSGHKNRGRMYVPYTYDSGISPLYGQGQGGNVSTIVTATATLFSTLNSQDWTADGVNNQQVSIMTGSGSSPGDAVTSVASNTVLETQRRRTNKDLPQNVYTHTV